MSANAQMTARGDAMYYVHSFLCLLIMFGFGQLPPVEPLTALGMRLIGIFLGLLYGWIFIDIVWPRKIPISLMPSAVNGSTGGS